ncbi:hypothetical protein F5I97DRAFT_1205912 [Phlebopus sp. FC_14]|nr:hypothetical protein F5I97DRAFT_1205912 [Phlebopus sp. FC_14]
MSAVQQAEKKGHVCPPSDAKHPSDRWESLFVYSFMCKFTNLRAKVEGLETPMDFENALLLPGPDPILSKILQQFILNLRPHTRNLSTDQISSTLSSVLADTFKGSERTVFWDDELKANVDPFAKLEGGFFAADWDLRQLKVLRQLVELQLLHSTEIKNTIDRAWGVVHNKHKKKDPITAPPNALDIMSQERLQLIPLGQDCSRKRYWVADDSPRTYVSTNPWKITATFQTVSSTRGEYLAVIENLNANAPQNDKKNKIEQAHVALIRALESRIDMIDTESARVQRVRRKIEQKQLLLAQAEIRETRTRRQTRRPDYVYDDVESGEDDADEYKFEEENDDDAFEQDGFLDSRSDARSQRRSSNLPVQRRSARTAKRKCASPDFPAHEWRSERRSSRLGALEDAHNELPPKRARTEESTASSGSPGWPVPPPAQSDGDSKAKINGAAAIKPTEIAVEQVRGKKKSKFWFYAVEPVSAPAGAEATSVFGGGISAIANGDGHNGGTGPSAPSRDTSEGMDVDSHIEGSLSPLPEGVKNLAGF